MHKATCPLQEIGNFQGWKLFPATIALIESYTKRPHLMATVFSLPRVNLCNVCQRPLLKFFYFSHLLHPLAVSCLYQNH